MPAGENDVFLDGSYPMKDSSQYNLVKSKRMPVLRTSRRLFIVHALHLFLFLITLIILIVGIFHWEYNVYIDSSQAGNVASYITLGFQTFFTVSVISLSVLSRAVAVDEAIRHPRTLLDLDAHIQAWGGLGNVFTNWHGMRSLGLLSSLIVAGAGVHLAGSSVLGVEIYNQTRTWDSEVGVTSHQGRYLDPFPMGSRSVQDYFTNTSLTWPTRDIDMFFSGVNNTRRPGLQRTLVHDLPGYFMYSYDVIHVNSTRMQGAMILLLPQHSILIRSTGTMDMWISVSMNSIPPYSDSAVNFSTYWDIHNNHSKVVLHPWALKDSLSFPSHHQILFAWATTDETAILLDTTGRNGTTYNFTLSGSDTPPLHVDARRYAEFIWEESSEERLANTFLTAFSPIPDSGDGMEWRDLGHTVAEKVLAMGLVNTTTWEAKYVRVTDLEEWIEGLFASWIWNIWRDCDYPYLLTSDSREICGNFHSSWGFITRTEDPGDTPQIVKAGITRTLEKGRLQIFRWRSIITFVCSAVLYPLLLATRNQNRLAKGRAIKGS
ncbi:uncharacterized protein EV420DRAFT_1639045 [Desarmillaria tabescens]|uniref:Uncharacterized protein n=1 Tax=Armillaria tabescens TaxID=1929756 RepID=A0AA39NC70_ARMTA|nr:uncharacterized protein EV420DRAFT_1639045 [Desarmillaria tabescens]KAK0462952.1 hypothetical protein EV420DRAFT_1639045 [Desarmillaria tabescens]